jgi:cyclase
MLRGMIRNLLALLLIAAAAHAAEPKKYEVQKLAEGVHAFVWSDPLADPIESNALIVINDEDVLVVDSSLFPSSARLVIGEIRKFTPKPVRYVVNTHWHDDHVLGNLAYREAFPAVEFIAHANTRKDIAEQVYAVQPEIIERYRGDLVKIRRALETGKTSKGETVTDERRKLFESYIPLLERYLAEIGPVNARPILPDLLLEDRLTLQRGARTIEIRHLGRGNTRGDVVVWLPQEKILAAGDLVVNPIPFGIGSYYREWITTLGALREIPAQTIFLSHGPVQRDKAYIDTVRGLLESLVSEVQQEAKRGATLEEVQQKVTLAEWKAKLAGENKDWQQAFDAYFVKPAVERVYRQEKGEGEGAERLK